MMNLKDQNIIVTGASGGIGSSIVEHLYEAGANILATGTRTEKLDQLKSKFSKIKTLPFDISKHDKIERFIDEANQLNAKVVLDNNEPINIKTLISLINNAKFIIANDTGPAHIASHLDKMGIVLFGSHTTAKKVSIENFNFKAITVENLNNLKVETVLEKIKSKLN